MITWLSTHHNIVDLTLVLDRLQRHSVNGIAVCAMEARDVQRHKIIGNVLQLSNK